MLVQSTVKHCWISKAKFENEKMKLKKKQNTNLEKSIFKKWVDRSQLGEKIEGEERQMLRDHRG